jgi:hypothetical protein
MPYTPYKTLYNCLRDWFLTNPQTSFEELHPDVAKEFEKLIEQVAEIIFTKPPEEN